MKPAFTKREHLHAKQSQSKKNSSQFSVFLQLWSRCLPASIANIHASNERAISSSRCLYGIGSPVLQLLEM